MFDILPSAINPFTMKLFLLAVVLSASSVSAITVEEADDALKAAKAAVQQAMQQYT